MPLLQPDSDDDDGGDDGEPEDAIRVSRKLRRLTKRLPAHGRAVVVQVTDAADGGTLYVSFELDERGMAKQAFPYWTAAPTEVYELASDDDGELSAWSLDG